MPQLHQLGLLLMLCTQNNTDGDKLITFSGIALHYGDNYIVWSGFVAWRMDKVEALHVCRHGYCNDNHSGIPYVLLVKSQVKMSQL